MMPEEESEIESPKTHKKSSKKRKTDVPHEFTVPENYSYCEIKQKKKLMKWKPIDPSVIEIFQQIQHGNAIPIFIDKSEIGQEASNLIRNCQRRVKKQCEKAIGPNTNCDFRTVQKDTRQADDEIEFLKAKIAYLDRQISREERKIEHLKGTTESE